MADSYLNKSGLSYFWTKIKNALNLKTDKTDFDLVDRYYRALVPVGTEIISNKNLNTVEFLSVGKYYCGKNANAATLTNCPTSGKAFMMEVFSPLSTTIDNETSGAWIYRLRVITTYEGRTWSQSCYSNETAGNWIYGSWQYMPTSGDVDNQIYANVNPKYGRVQVSGYSADSGQWVKIASMSHHTRVHDNVNYTFRLDFTGSGTTQYRKSYTFGVGARMSNTSLSSVRFDYLDSEKFNFDSAPEFENLVKVTKKWVAGSSSADHYIHFEIWVKLISGWRVYWLHPTNMNYKYDYSIAQAFYSNSDEWTYSNISGTSAEIGQETYLTNGYEEVPMVDARKGVSYLDPIYTTRQTTADAPEINGRGGIRTFVATSSMSDRPAGLDGHILHLDWDNTGGYDTQLMVTNSDRIGPRIYARGMKKSTWGNWVRFIREEDMVSKVNRNAFYNNTTNSVTYKKVIITGLPGATEVDGYNTYRGAGAFIFGRKQFYAISGAAGSEIKTAFYEIGTNNNGIAINTNDMNLHIKAVYGGDSNPPKITLYVALERYGYCDIHSSGTITIEDSDSTEWEGITADIVCKPILASLKEASGGDLGNITAGAKKQSYLEVKKIDTATDINALKTTGLYIIGTSGCSNIPSGAGRGTIYVDWTIVTKYQIYINDGDSWKIWKREWNSADSTWGSWIKQVETADIKNGVLTIQKNGEDVQTFSANQSSNVTANIEVPTTMVGATNSSSGSSGIVPAPSAGDNVKYLSGDGTWSIPSSTYSSFLRNSPGTFGYWKKLGNLTFSKHEQGQSVFLKILIGFGNNGNNNQQAFIDLVGQLGWTGSYSGRAGWTAIFNEMNTNRTLSDFVIKVIANSVLNYDVYIYVSTTYTSVTPIYVHGRDSNGKENVIWTPDYSAWTKTAPTGTECDIAVKTTALIDDIPTTYSGSSITDGSITFDKTASGEFLKLETSTTDPGEGTPLASNTLLAVYDVIDDYRRGEVLVSTQNVDTLATTSNVAAVWSTGTWTQFGRMASSSNKHILTIENPTSNNWIVEISLDCPSVLPGSVINGSSIISTTPATGIAELDSNNAISKVITWTRITNRSSVYNRKYVTIPANTTKKFCACVCTYQTASNPTGTWEGGDEISGTAVGAGFGGPSCTLTAVLIDNGE